MSYYTQSKHKFFAVYKNTCDPLIGYTHKKRIDNWFETQIHHPKEQIEIISKETLYSRANEDVTVFNPFTGNLVTMKAREVGGPCDPTTERYHTM